MSYIVDIDEDLNEQLQSQIRKFVRKSNGTDYQGWYRIQKAIIRARETKIYHDTIENYILPNLFDDKGDPIMWYHSRDPQYYQVYMVRQNLKNTSTRTYRRGRVTPYKLKIMLEKILRQRVKQFLNKKDNMEKLKIMCIVGESGVGKTLASLHLKYHKDANVICSFTTREPRNTEVEGRDHHFIDIVPDKTELLAYTHFSGHYYYALKTQVEGPCTVYVVDEKGIDNLRKDHGDEYDIYTVLIKRDRDKRKHVGIDAYRMKRDNKRTIIDSNYDFIVVNNSSKKEFFKEIERIYEYIKNK